MNAPIYFVKKNYVSLLIGMLYIYNSAIMTGQEELSFYKKSLILNVDLAEMDYVKNNITHDYYLKKDYQKAIDSALAARIFIKKWIPAYLSYNSAFLATYYGAIGDFDNAILYSKKNMSNTQVIDKLPEYYQELEWFYEQKAKIELASVAKKKNKTVIDSIHAFEQQQLAQFYDTKLIENPNPSIKTASDTKIKFLVITSLGISFLLFSCGMIYYSKIRQNRLLELDPNHQTEILKSEIRSKKDTLSLIRISQEERAKQLVSCKKKLLSVSQNNNLKEITEVTQTIDGLIGALSPTESLLEDKNPRQHNFIYLLRKEHPQLSDTDLKHCLFIHKGLSLKEIAELLHVTPNTVKTARYRAKSKINRGGMLIGTSFKTYLSILYNYTHKRQY